MLKNYKPGQHHVYPANVKTYYSGKFSLHRSNSRLTWHLNSMVSPILLYPSFGLFHSLIPLITKHFSYLAFIALGNSYNFSVFDLRLSFTILEGLNCGIFIACATPNKFNFLLSLTIISPALLCSFSISVSPKYIHFNALFCNFWKTSIYFSALEL